MEALSPAFLSSRWLGPGREAHWAIRCGTLVTSGGRKSAQAMVASGDNEETEAQRKLD